jgi:hypothetical protein
MMDRGYGGDREGEKCDYAELTQVLESVSIRCHILTYFRQTRNDLPELPPGGLTSKTVTDHIITLFKILDSFRKLPNLCAMVFVDRRLTADLLVEIIRHREEMLEGQLGDGVTRFIPELLLGRSDKGYGGTFL